MAKKNPDIPIEVKYDRELATLRNHMAIIKQKYKESMKQLDIVSRERDSVLAIKDTIQPFIIEPRNSGGHSESTAIIVSSDWHIEERVESKKVSGLNRFDIDIAKTRGEMFFKNSLRLIEVTSKDTDVATLVLALLGDFFSNDIHDELAEGNQLLPMDAVLLAQNLIASGIEFLLKNSKVNIVIPCHSGNHARTTRKVHVSTETGHSLEFFMYHNLANYFRNESRIKFVIADGYHTYVQVYDKMIRFHHGHMIKYAGGVGGIYIPVNKAISQWNKGKHADIDVFGHFHQFRDGGNFICNGSLIGYNAYALSIKAEYERPQQAFFLIHKTKGKIFVAPVLLE